MTFVVADRVRETTSTTGTGPVTLAGAVLGHRAFSAVCANGDTVDYCIAAGSEWEVGTGTWATGGSLARTTVLASSNAGAAVSFSAGSKDVFCTLPAALFNGGWVTSFVPQLDQGASTNIAKTVTKSQWRYDGPMIEFECRLDVTGPGTPPSPVTVSLPIPALSSANDCMGPSMIFRASTSWYYVGVCLSSSTTGVVFGSAAANGLYGTSPNVSIVSGDQIRFLARYRWV